MNTAELRKRFPSRYIRKDARTAIYRALYGEAAGPDPKGRPSLNEHRKLPQFINVQGVRHTMDTHKEDANFSKREWNWLEERYAQVVSLSRRNAKSEGIDPS